MNHDSPSKEALLTVLQDAEAPQRGYIHRETDTKVLGSNRDQSLQSQAHCAPPDFNSVTDDHPPPRRITPNLGPLQVTSQNPQGRGTHGAAA